MQVIGPELITAVLNGFNASLMAYGQSGGGKTHSLIGFNAKPVGESRGCIPRTVEVRFS
jgi:hypothetical protein